LKDKLSQSFFED